MDAKAKGILHQQLLNINLHWQPQLLANMSDSHPGSDSVLAEA